MSCAETAILVPVDIAIGTKASTIAAIRQKRRMLSQTKGQREVGTGHANSSAVDPSATSGVVDQSQVPEYITEVKPTDVLLGRGAPIINNLGNVAFRNLVRTRKQEYLSTGRHQVKDEIARDIVREVHNRKGRFLRRIETAAEIAELGVPEGVKAYRVADEAVAIEKAKQALRDKEPSSTNKSPNLKASETPDSGRYSPRKSDVHPETTTSSNLGNGMNTISIGTAELMRSGVSNPTLHQLIQQQESNRQRVALYQQQTLQEQQLRTLQQQQQHRALLNLFGLATPNVTNPSNQLPLAANSSLTSFESSRMLSLPGSNLLQPSPYPVTSLSTLLDPAQVANNISLLRGSLAITQQQMYNMQGGGVGVSMPLSFQGGSSQPFTSTEGRASAFINAPMNPMLLQLLNEQSIAKAADIERLNRTSSPSRIGADASIHRSTVTSRGNNAENPVPKSSPTITSRRRNRDGSTTALGDSSGQEHSMEGSRSHGEGNVENDTEPTSSTGSSATLPNTECPNNHDDGETVNMKPRPKKPRPNNE